eukprot:CAMPEP_0181298248 /NCGR_PEP_ID=MMETSP1101-20121128/5681_1 /TAXON_ID=46948 /ORGANISM="Rhodomonas abbreviata, Strain Caron Lab Isolate" /LENGTH=203 /DNA_ID=CAMNT_0023403257 /DNA_START=193 /DNA_END=804 /DNA_ORIENTATION=-
MAFHSEAGGMEWTYPSHMGEFGTSMGDSGNSGRDRDCFSATGGYGLLQRRGRTALQPIQVSLPSSGPFSVSEDSMESDCMEPDVFGGRTDAFSVEVPRSPRSMQPSHFFGNSHHENNDISFEYAERRVRKVPTGNQSAASFSERVCDSLMEEHDRAKRGCFRQAEQCHLPPSFGTGEFIHPLPPHLLNQNLFNSRPMVQVPWG